MQPSVAGSLQRPFSNPLGSLKSKFAGALDALNMDKLQEKLKEQEAQSVGQQNGISVNGPQSRRVSVVLTPSHSQQPAALPPKSAQTAASLISEARRLSLWPAVAAPAPAPAPAPQTWSGKDTESAAEQALLADLQAAGISYNPEDDKRSASGYGGISRNTTSNNRSAVSSAGANENGGRMAAPIDVSSRAAGIDGATESTEVLTRLVPQPIAAAATTGATALSDAFKLTAGFVAGGVASAVDRIGVVAQSVPLSFPGSIGQGGAGGGPGRTIRQQAANFWQLGKPGSSNAGNGSDGGSSGSNRNGDGDLRVAAALGGGGQLQGQSHLVDDSGQRIPFMTVSGLFGSNSNSSSSGRGMINPAAAASSSSASSAPSQLLRRITGTVCYPCMSAAETISPFLTLLLVPLVLLFRTTGYTLAALAACFGFSGASRFCRRIASDTPSKVIGWVFGLALLLYVTYWLGLHTYAVSAAGSVYSSTIATGRDLIDNQTAVVPTPEPSLLPAAGSSPLPAASSVSSVAAAIVASDSMPASSSPQPAAAAASAVARALLLDSASVARHLRGMISR